MGSPRNSTISGDGFRFYRLEHPETGESFDLLSVTSIRRLTGISWQLSAWQIANVIDVAMGTIRREVIGPRGGIKKVQVADDYPGEFARRLLATDGETGKLDALRKWVHAQADEPRNIAAVRGTIVHEAIEKNVAWDRIERAYVEDAFANLSARDKTKVARGVLDDDISFVRNGVHNYWAMREEVPMILLAREVSVVNFTAGYAGTFDALAWLLPEGIDRSKLPPTDKITVDTIRLFGGKLVLLDWKTSKDVHTDQVIQAHAYLSAEYAFVEDKVDRRLTDMLAAAHYGGLAHIRPNGWGLYMFGYKQPVVRAFLGSVAFARFVGQYPHANTLFDEKLTGQADTSEEVEEIAA